MQYKIRKFHIENNQIGGHSKYMYGIQKLFAQTHPFLIICLGLSHDNHNFHSFLRILLTGITKCVIYSKGIFDITDRIIILVGRFR